MLVLSKKPKRVAISVFCGTAIVFVMAGVVIGLASFASTYLLLSLMAILSVYVLSMSIYQELEEKDTKNRNNGECPD